MEIKKVAKSITLTSQTIEFVDNYRGLGTNFSNNIESIVIDFQVIREKAIVKIDQMMVRYNLSLEDVALLHDGTNMSLPCVEVNTLDQVLMMYMLYMASVGKDANENVISFLKELNEYEVIVLMNYLKTIDYKKAL